MSQEHTYKRRHFFVKKGYQFRFILKFCLIVLAGTAISSGLLFLFSRGTLTSSFENSRLAIENTAFAILPSLLYINIFTLVVITLATVVAVLFISHKIAGPMFRFEKELEEIGQGDLTKKIHLRKKDQITDMAESLNRMTASLHDKVHAIQTEVERLSQAASKEGGPAGLIEGLNHLQESIGKNFKIRA